MQCVVPISVELVAAEVNLRYFASSVEFGSESVLPIGDAFGKSAAKIVCPT